jgi:hypothetical protein
MRTMRHQSTVTSISWIPSEAITGSTRVAFDAGFTHYDDPPPAQVDDLEALRTAGRFRFANVLTAWIDVDSAGEIGNCGYGAGGLIGDTTVRPWPGALHVPERPAAGCAART